MKFKFDLAALQAKWASLSPNTRTFLNVVAGSVIAAIVTFLVEGLSAGEIDVNELVQVILTALGTAIARALNPADASRGLGAEVPTEVYTGPVEVDLDAEHEAIDWDTL